MACAYPGASTFVRSRRRAAFLDRDGTLIEPAPAPERYVKDANDVRLLPGVGPGMRKLRSWGFLLVVVTNQRWIASDPAGPERYTAVDRELKRQLRQEGVTLDASYCCPHEKGVCGCRKPKPGLLHQALRDFPTVSASCSVMVGDHKRDMIAARLAGVPGVMVASTPAATSHFPPLCNDEWLGTPTCVESFAAAVDAIVHY